MFRLFNNVPDLYMPMLWFKLKVEVTEEMASNIKLLLALPIVMLCSGIFMTIIGLCLIVTMVLLYFGKKRRIIQTVRTFILIPKNLRILFLFALKENCIFRNRVLQNITTEKMVDNPDKKTEMVYIDKMSSNDDSNAKSDRRLYAKP